MFKCIFKQETRATQAQSSLYASAMLHHTTMVWPCEKGPVSPDISLLDMGTLTS